MSKIKLLSLFSGIGAFEKALKNVGIDFELIHFCEIDKFASTAYCAVHDESPDKNLCDITAVDVESLPKVDLITYGFPCQDISTAGKQRGFTNEDGELTRSGLFFRAADIIAHCRPKVAIAENVKALTSKKFSEEFKTVLKTLEQLGYTNYWQVLNAKDYGIPQNRERVFIVSIRNDFDVFFQFHEGRPLSKSLKDFLEAEPVAKNFYMKPERIKSLDFGKIEKSQKIEKVGELNSGGENAVILSPQGICTCLKATDYKNPKKIICVGKTCSGGERSEIIHPDGICSCLTATDYKQPKQIFVDKIVQIGNYKDGAKFTNPQAGRVYSPEGLCPTLNTMQGGDLQPKIIVNAVPDGTVATGVAKNGVVRKLTPLECWRLMGFSDQDFKVAQSTGLSNTQLYKQAGNSICVQVLEAIFLELKNKGFI